MKNNQIQTSSKKIISSFLASGILGILGVAAFNAASASAVTYQSETPVEFTFNPTLSMSLSSSNIKIDELNPGSSADSNIITINVATNAAYGYVLSSTVGVKGGTSNLVNSTDNNYKFTNLSSTAATLNNFPDNTWGYSYSNDNGSTWVSGNAGSATSGYAGLPLDNNDNADERGKGGVTLISTDNPADNKSIKFKIGAKASSSQAAGTYVNAINFYAVTNPEPAPGLCTDTATCMQTMATCPTTATTVTDARDGEQYLVQQLADGNCWMLDNLRLDPTAVSLADLQGKTNASNQTLTYFKNGGGSSPYPASGVSNAWTSSSQNKYDLPYINATDKNNTTTSYGAGSGKIGVYYNYCAASAGSYCYSSSSSTGDATEDICPSGWRMPTGNTGGEYDALYTAYSSDDGAFRNALSTPLSGWFVHGSARSQGTFGDFWSSTRSNNTHMYNLHVTSLIVINAHYRYSGLSVRCLLDD